MTAIYIYLPFSFCVHYSSGYLLSHNKLSQKLAAQKKHFILLMIRGIRNSGRAPNGALLCSTRQQVRLENQLPTWLTHMAGKLGLAVDQEPWFLSMNLPGLHHNTAAKSLPQTKCSKRQEVEAASLSGAGSGNWQSLLPKSMTQSRDSPP